MRKQYWVDLICGLLILLFLYPALSKLLHYRLFRSVLSLSPLIGSFSDWIAWMLPFTEILVSGLLFFPATKRIGLYGSLFILIILTIYILYMLLFVPYLPCNCGGVIGTMSWRQHLVFNLLITGLAAAGLQLSRKPKKGWGGPLPYPTRADVRS